MVGPAGADVGHEGDVVAGLAPTATTDDDAIDGTFNFALTPSHTPEHFYAYLLSRDTRSPRRRRNPTLCRSLNSLQVLTVILVAVTMGLAL